MVDFNNDSTITRSAKDILAVLIIEKRTYVIDAIEQYIKDKSRGIHPSISIVKARLHSFYIEILPSIAKSYNDDEHKKLYALITSTNIEDLIKGFNELSNYLYVKKLIMWDSMRQYDPSSAEQENEFHGLG